MTEENKDYVEELEQEENVETVETEDNDVTIEEGESYSIVENAEDYLSFSIEGLYSDEKETKYNKPLALKRNPPKLEISSSNGDQVSFPLTSSLTKSMVRVLEDVNFAYLGIRKTKKRFNMGEKLGFLAKVSDIFNSTKLSFVQLFLGMLLGISIVSSFMIGIIVTIALAVAVTLFHYSKNNNEKGENK